MFPTQPQTAHARGQPPAAAGAADASRQSSLAGGDDSRRRSVTDSWQTETDLSGAAQPRSASRDSQVRSTAQRSGRCSIGIRRFKSCSLHSTARPNGRAVGVAGRFDPRESQRPSTARPTVSRLHSVLRRRLDTVSTDTTHRRATTPSRTRHSAAHVRQRVVHTRHSAAHVRQRVVTQQHRRSL